MLDDVEARSVAPTLTDLVATLIDPVLAQLDTPWGAHYVQIKAAPVAFPRRDQLPEVLQHPEQRLHRVQRLMSGLDAHEPQRPDLTRAIVVGLIFHSLADFSRTPS